MAKNGHVLAVGFSDAYSRGRVRVYDWKSEDDDNDIKGSWTQRGVDIEGEAFGDYSGCSIDISDDGSIIAI
eukprot:CAMPEP_0202472552 /NCGR_PEP_ID=MMETSP1360-20130828/88164_1 /ASSEMBLY_ACC=CAM_ASM_000848 /TAXON_ID=515479 /ORGANISM="Licmophora paradoxa, Strain CCMP2313" /LENGTH=70 /DNA_ID=CAMNT_0049099095 /DNA_START=96 /DNA_END=305 /DNA_ORIENTATION=-